MWLYEVRPLSGRGVQRRLYEALRQAVLTGELPPGTRLPPTRAVAGELRVARQTVVLAYERLLAEGYVVGRVGVGTFVSPALQGVPGAQAATGVAPAEPPTEHADGDRHPAARGFTPSPWAQRAVALPRDSWAPAGLRLDFRPGVPDWRAFPHARWRRLLARRWRSNAALGATGELGQYGDPAGYRPLRDALATHLARSRGLRCSADQVLIVSGSQQALDLLVRVCLGAGDVAAMEDPGYPPARAVFRAAGVRVEPVPVDAAGLIVSALDRRAGPAGTGTPMAGADPAATPRLIFVTPSHQYPTGATLTLERRLELLEWAGRAGAVVVEDDYDSEFRYAAAPLPALQGLDERGCVAYVGSCSSVLFPPLRVGWVVAPAALVAALVAAKWLADRQTSTLDQQVLTDFIAAGDFARHLRRSRTLYGARRAALAAAVQRHLPATCRLGGELAGLQAPLYLPVGTDEAAVVAAAAARDVGVYPLSACNATGGSATADVLGRPSGLLLGFAAMEEATIDEGVRRLGEALPSPAESAKGKEHRPAGGP